MSQHLQEIKRALDKVYSTESSKLDEVISEMQRRSIPEEDWSAEYAIFREKLQADKELQSE